MTNPYPLPRQTRETDVIVGDGRSTFGPFAFRIWDAADATAVVSRQGGEFLPEAIVAAKTTAERFAFFTVTFAPALAAGDRAIVRSTRLHERLGDVTRGGSISGAELERELSTQGTILQELRRDETFNAFEIVRERADRLLEVATERAARVAGDRAERDARVAAIEQEHEERVDADLRERHERQGADEAERGERIEADRIERQTREDTDRFLHGLIGDHYGRDTLNPTSVSSRQAVPLLQIDPAVSYIRTAGYHFPGDGGAGLYARSANEPAHPAKVRDASGAWWTYADAEITPLHLGAVSTTMADTDATTRIQEAVQAATALGIVLRWRGRFGLTSKITVPATLMMEADRRALLRAIGNVPTAIELLPGNATGTNGLPALQDFSGKALVVRSSLGRYRVPQILGCHTGVQFLADGSNVLDTVVEVEAISTGSRGVEFNATAASRVIQGCGLCYNFITAVMYPVVFDGTPCFWDGLFARGEAIDLTANEAAGVVLHNVSGGLVPRFTLKVNSWIGGDGFATAPFAKIASGVWNAADLHLVNAFAFDQRNITDNTLQASRVDTRGHNAAPRVMSQTAGIANYPNAKADSSTTLALSGTTNTVWPTGGVKDFIAYNIWTDRNYDVWHAVMRLAPAGVFLQWIADETTAEAHRIRLRFYNSGPERAAPATVELTLFRD